MDHSAFQKSSDVLCAVPCFNEEYNLPALLKDLNSLKASSHCDIIFINDCSKDQTAKILNNTSYQVIHHKKNSGYGSSVQTGFSFAQQSQYDYFIIFPGDHQRSVHDLLKLIQMIKKSSHDVVTGSKFHIYSEKYGPINRRIGNRIFSFIARRFWGSPIEDVLSGFKIYKVNSVKEFFHMLPLGYPFDICFSLYSSVWNLKIMETPVDCRYDEHTSKMNSVIWVSAKMLSAVLIHYFFRIPFLRLTKINKFKI